MLPSFVLPQIVIRTLATRLRIFKVPAPSASPALKPLESALPQNGRVTRLESADPKTLDLKSFRIRTYKKGGEGDQTVNQKMPLPGRCKHLAGPVSYCARDVAAAW